MRHLVGYYRFASKATYAELTRVFELARVSVNFFQPVQKLVSKTRAGARTQHSLGSCADPVPAPVCPPHVLPTATRADLEALYQGLNLLQLRHDLGAGGGARDITMQIGQPLGVVADQVLSVQPVEVVASKVPVGSAVAKNLPRGDKDGVADGDDGFFIATSARDPMRRWLR